MRVLERYGNRALSPTTSSANPTKTVSLSFITQIIADVLGTTDPSRWCSAHSAPRVPPKTRHPSLSALTWTHNGGGGGAVVVGVVLKPGGGVALVVFVVALEPGGLPAVACAP